MITLALGNEVRNCASHHIFRHAELWCILCPKEFFILSDFLFRYNIPELAKKYKVYALDLLGFGWSEKALIEYDALVWRDQVVDFLKEVVKEPAVLVGNR